MSKCCLGPYTVSAAGHQVLDQYRTIDPTKTYRVAVFSAPSQPILPPTPEAVVVQQRLGVGLESYNITWYECPDKLGRVYTTIPNACSVVITSFENGLLSEHGADASIFGSQEFCFGKNRIGDQVVESENLCRIVFTFDGSSFAVSATESDSNGLFDCSGCFGSVALFGELPADLPTAAQATEAEVFNLYSGSTGTVESRMEWDTGPEKTESVGTTCDDEVDVSAHLSKTPCESHLNPSIATRISGKSIVAFQHIDPEGESRIRLETNSIPSTVPYNIVYYRSGSKARIPVQDTSKDTTVQLEVFDDLELNDVSSLAVGFLTGPLAGHDVFDVNQLQREIVGNQVVNTIYFDRGSRQLDFEGEEYFAEFFLTGRGGISTLSFSAPEIQKDHTIESFSIETPPQAQPAEPSVELMEALTCPGMPGDDQAITVPANYIYTDLYQIVNNPAGKVLRRMDMEVQGEAGTKVYLVAYWNTTAHLPVFVKAVTLSSSTRQTISTGDIAVTLANSDTIFLGVLANKDITIWTDNTSANLNISPDVLVYCGYYWPNVYGPVRYGLGNPVRGNNKHLHMQVCFGTNTAITNPQEFPNDPCLKIESKATDTTPTMQFSAIGPQFVLATNLNKWLRQVKFDIQGTAGSEAFILIYKGTTLVEIKKHILATSDRHWLVHDTNVDLNVPSGTVAPNNYLRILIGTRQSTLKVFSISGAAAYMTRYTSLGTVDRSAYIHRIILPAEFPGASLQQNLSYLPAFELCVADSSNGNTPQIVSGFEEIELGDDSVEYTYSYQIFTGSRIQTTATTTYLTGFQQKLAVPKGAEVFLIVKTPTTMVYQKRLVSTNAAPTWYSTGPMNLSLTKGTDYYILACTNAPGCKHYRADLSSFSNVFAPWGTFVEDRFGLFMGPMQTACGEVGYYSYKSAWHQKLTFSPTPGSGSNELYNTYKGEYVLGTDRVAAATTMGSSNWIIANQIRITPGLTVQLTKLAAYLRISGATPVDLYWYVFDPDHRVVFEQKTTVTPKTGVAKYSCDLLSLGLNCSITGITTTTRTYVGVGWRSSAVKVVQEKRNSDYPSWWGNLLGYAMCTTVVPGGITYAPLTLGPASPMTVYPITVEFNGPVMDKGACCRGDLVCLDSIQEAECTDVFSGTYQGNGVECSHIACTAPPKLGACCNRINGSCTQTYEVDCIGANLQWLGPETNCTQCTTGAQGACCLSDGSCLYTTYADCMTKGGSGWSEGLNCTPNPCTAQAMHACCVGGVCIPALDLADCISKGGSTSSYYESWNCNDFTCPSDPRKGCCCRDDGTYLLATLEECKLDHPDNVFQGAGTNCSTHPCENLPLTNDDALDLPPHRHDGEVVAVANPDVAVARNHLMIDRSEYTNVVYQARENNAWEVYLRQIRTIGRDAEPSSPKYAYPYVFAPPVFEKAAIFPDSTIKYVVEEKRTQGTQNCILCSAYLDWGARLINCDSTGSSLTTEGCNFAIDPTKVYVVVQYDMSGAAPCDPATAPTWDVGDEFFGPAPPIASTFGAAESCTTVTAYPSLINWCYNRATCSQTHLYDDPYCPLPYLAAIYKPEDLWTLKDGNDTFTRVKYHIAVETENSYLLPTGGTSTKSVDLMFVIDYSASMGAYIERVRQAIPKFAHDMAVDGIDIRFGLVVFGRGKAGSLQPTVYSTCPTTPIGSAMFNGLQNFPISQAIDGFTRDWRVIDQAMKFWTNIGGQAPGYTAVQYALNEPTIAWRDSAIKYAVLVTDTTDKESSTGCTYSNTLTAAVSELTAHACTCIAVVSALGVNYVTMSQNSGWTGGAFDISSSSYAAFLDAIRNELVTTYSRANVVERDTAGFDPTFLKPAEVIITYEGDLSELWTYRKTKLEFRDIAPTDEGITKGLSMMPYPLASQRVYNIESVHLNGDPANWVFFEKAGPITLIHPQIGNLPIARSNPIHIGTGFNPVVAVNNRNEVFVAYETQENGPNQIVIKGTGDFAQNSITGPKASRLTKFVRSLDFCYEAEVTLPGEGVNQLCDMVIDKSDVVHLAWQSNRDGVWEIYYANGLNMFAPTRITSSSGRSVKPSIDVDDTGNVYIAFQDDRYGRNQVMLAYKLENRVKPLIEQDEYHASLRSGYRHFVDTVPVWIEHPRAEAPEPGKLWVTKPSYVFALDVSTGRIDNEGGGTNTYDISAIAGSYDGYVYGLNNDGMVLKMATPTEGDYLDLIVGE